MRERRRIKIGYLKVKEVRGLLRVELIPISEEEARRLLRG